MTDNSRNIIKITNGVPRHPDYKFKAPLNLEFKTGEHIAIVGPNGGGKTMLVDVLTGAHPLLITKVEYDFGEGHTDKAYDNIKYMTFRDSYGESDRNYYYQQRWNQHDIEDTPIVDDILNEAYDAYGDDTKERRAFRNKLYDIFKLNRLLDKHVILLSSGELRKFQLTKTLLGYPSVLIMDNPYIGLDANARTQLTELLQTIVSETEIMLILVISKTDDIPDFITHVVSVQEMTVSPKTSLEDYKLSVGNEKNPVLSNERRQMILDLPVHTDDYNAPEIIDFHNVSIRYGERTILKELNWKVRNGERWALQGENGSGKSTLLSLVCADNPQSYACDISLFGKKRGSGETIWDIKKHIGYISPEMHRAYIKDVAVNEIVASGYSDKAGLYVKPTPDNLKACEYWLEIFGIKHLKDSTFLKISSGEQRLCLLARAFVKDPELLILDEPLHGLDMKNRKMVKEIIETFCSRKNKTLIMVTHYKNELPEVMTNYITLKRND